MTTPPLMSERGELRGTRWLDCAYAAGMMLAYKAGIRAFPLGWTDREREALESSDSRPDETSANYTNIEEALRVRYRIITGHTTNIGATLRGPATTGIQLFGLWSAVPRTYRRWTNYLGGHSVYAEPVGDGVNCLMHDPLAPTGTGPLRIPASVLEKFALTYGTHQQLTVTEPKAEETMWRIVGKAEEWTAAAGCVLRATPDISAPIVGRITAGTKVFTLGEVHTVATSPDNDWRFTVLPDKSTKFLVRRDLVPTVQGGDPALQQGYADFAARTSPATTTTTSAFNDGVTAASAAALTAKR